MFRSVVATFNPKTKLDDTEDESEIENVAQIYSEIIEQIEEPIFSELTSEVDSILYKHKPTVRLVSQPL